MSNQSTTRSIDNYQNLILSITRDIATVQNREDLNKLIKGTLSPVLGFTHSTVFILNNEGSEIINFLDNYSNIRDGYQEPVFIGKIPFSHKANAGSAIRHFFDLDDLVQKGNIAPFLTSSDAPEYGSFLTFELVKGGEGIGLWLLLFEEEYKGKAISTVLCELIASNLTLAILNIKAQETIEKNKKEQEIVQALNVDFVTIREKQDLLKIIHFKLGSIFNFRHHWVATVNEDQLTMSTFMQDTESKTKSHPKYKHLTYAKYTIADKIFNRVILAGEPQVFDLEKILATGTLPEYLQINYESGIRKVVMQSLELAGKFIGVWALCLGEHDEIDHNYINLVKDIANQFSIAVGNIIANETIQSRQAEQELLLKLSCDITSVKSRESLLKALKLNLKKMFNFRRLTILTMNDGSHTPQIFLSTDPTAENLSLASYTRWPIQDDIFDKCILTAEPLIFDLEALTDSRNGDLPLYLKVNYESGLKKAVIIRFSKSEDVFGFWILFFDHDLVWDKGKQNLIKGISHQISIAVSNIVANEEITKREEEKTRLLAFSNAIASVKSIREISSVINAQLTAWGIIGDHCMHIVNDDKVTHSLYLYDQEALWTKLPQFKEIKAGKYPIADGIMDGMISGNRLMAHNIQKYDNRNELPRYVEYWKLAGMSEIASIPVNMGNKLIGILILKLSAPFAQLTNQQSLLISICSQIAIAVSNLTANEKINKQLAEIEQYKGQLEDQTSYLKEEIEITQNYGDIIGESWAIRKTFKLVSQVAMSDSTVLIQGETGTGKELIARAIHNSSPRKDKLMVKVNCAALPPNLIESELFGHERGSFTGATEQRIGKIELAKNSTLFLDEIGEMSLDLQVKLLRALQEKEIERVGGNKTIKVDIRIVAATNRDLEKEVAKGRFRSDLYYRLNIFPISLPPLRDRKEDIPLLAAYFVRRFAQKAGRQITTFSDIAMQHMMRYSWPGNIRELEHVIERCVLLSSGDAIKFADLLPLSKPASPDPTAIETTLKTIDENERDHILRILKYCGGKIAGDSGAAQILGVPAGTLYSKMKKLGIKREHSI
ncbi:sigma 54-interacting transcriptional regulator [Chitinophaga sp. S165]|uniref:sigma 54-interacting transcriptional regulator n=1 Tax=Chitinophaga sp. S165 TaxID=2135462 RepID=UPI000D718B27|nr:sigma 54-interacting transcriptional regulator [Chitinophaga sp. S165]PWV56829.1 transcriptional regulator with GAF, ATPase, and Fis domain [Chitinophaga sp. S165]